VAPLTWIQWHIAVERSREDGHWRTYANDNQLSYRQRSTGPPEHQRAYPGSAERSACQTETVHPGSSPRLRAAVRGRRVRVSIQLPGLVPLYNLKMFSACSASDSALP
jgi:hypothetical protein